MMAPQLYTHAFNISSVENRRLCINGTPWIWHLLEECVENAWEYWSVVIGLISIVCFLFAALPQLYVAYQNGKVDQALSLGFLLCWIGGDLTNFIGCYLTNQLPIQNTLGMIEMSGFICGYVSCMFYLGSRFPQLYKNRQGRKTAHLSERTGEVDLNLKVGAEFQRRSTEGTSYLLFALAMMGNCTYGLSLVLKMPAAKALRNLYFLHHLPWLIGSFGVLFLDIFPYEFKCNTSTEEPWGRSTYSPDRHSEIDPLVVDLGGLVKTRQINSRSLSSLSLYPTPDEKSEGFLEIQPALLDSFPLQVSPPGDPGHPFPEGVEVCLTAGVCLGLMTAQFIMYRKQNKRRPSLVAMEVEPLLVNEEDS
ncbi:lysosomal amino acid transporter 1 homolog isoform X4 [Caretta caretta]|uniref:lysosomal amino acid transporter 1 homolog isoform X4 n=1 Tax=Caretta caretta TaxID=8467 RepID=UPI003F4B01C2